MALNADLLVLTQPGATGNQTYALPANFNPKAVILWGVPLAADGIAASYAYGMGFGTYRGAVVQQRFATMRGLDAAAAADTAYGSHNNALFVLQTQAAGMGTRDLEIGLVSMATGAGSNVILNWANLHTTASIRIFMLVLGGSDITDAVVGDFTVGIGSATQDVALPAGFGKPELAFFNHFSNVSQLNDTGDAALGFGFCKQGESGRGFFYTQADGNTNSVTATSQRSDRCLLDTTPAGTVQWSGRLDTVAANWPTDSFRILWDAIPLDPGIVNYLALRGTFQSKTGASAAPITGTPPVVQDNAAGFAPKLGFNFGWNLPASTAWQTAAGEQCGFGIGATDGTDEAWAGFTEDDGLATMNSNQMQSNTKFNQNYSQSATLTSEADGSFSGNNLRLSWNDIDTVAREYQWLALGDAVVSGPVLTPISFAVGMTVAPAMARVMLALRVQQIVATFTAAMVKRISFFPNVVVTFAATFARAFVYPRTISTGVTFTPTMGRVSTRFRTLAVVVTFAATISKLNLRYRTMAAALIMTAALVRVRYGYRQFDAGLNFTAALVASKAYTRLLPLGVTVSGSMTKTTIFARVISTGMTLTGNMTIKGLYARTLAASVTMTPTMSRLLFKFITFPLVVAFTAALVVTRLFKRTFAAGLNFTNTMTGLKGVSRTLPVGMTVAPTISRTAIRPRLLAVGIDFTNAATLLRLFKRTFSVTATFTTTISRLAVRLRSFALTVALAVTMVGGRITFRTFVAAVNFTVTMARLAIRKILFALGITITPTMLNSATFKRTFSGSLSLPATLTRLVTRPRAFVASMTLTAALTRVKINVRAHVVVVTLTSALSRLATRKRVFDTGLTFTPTISRLALLKRSFTQVVTFAPIMNFSSTGMFQRQLDVAMNFTTALSLRKMLSRTLAIPLALSAALSRLGLRNRTLSTGVTLDPTIQRKINFNSFSQVLQFVAEMRKMHFKQMVANLIFMAQLNVRQDYEILLAVTMTIVTGFQSAVQKFKDFLGRIGLRKPSILSAKADTPEISSILEPDVHAGSTGLNTPNIHKTRVRKGEIDG